MCLIFFSDLRPRKKRGRRRSRQFPPFRANGRAQSRPIINHAFASPGRVQLKGQPHNTARHPKLCHQAPLFCVFPQEVAAERVQIIFQTAEKNSKLFRQATRLSSGSLAAHKTSPALAVPLINDSLSTCVVAGQETSAHFLSSVVAQAHQQILFQDIDRFLLI